MEHIIQSLSQFWEYTGFANCSWQNLVMIGIGLVFITLAIVKEWEPMLLVPIGFGMVIGNIPMFPGLNIGIYEDGSVLNILYQGVRQGWYPPLIFLGIGAMTDFSALISQPRLILIGAAAQMGIFGAYLLALAFGFAPNEAGAIGIIGGADGPTAIFLSSKLAPDLMGAIAVSAYSYMALRHRGVGLFLHGPRSGDPEADHAPADHQEGAPHPNARSAPGFPEREDHLPDRGLPHLRVHRSFRPAAAGYALLR